MFGQTQQCYSKGTGKCTKTWMLASDVQKRGAFIAVCVCVFADVFSANGRMFGLLAINR